eukprot:Platyproteum_vivax@DN4733_c0_g1_i1.p1
MLRLGYRSALPLLKGVRFMPRVFPSLARQFHSEALGDQEEDFYAPLVGAKASDFSCQAVMPNGEIEDMKLSSFAQQKTSVYLLFYPFDFTFVCPSELLAFNNAIGKFEERGVQVVGVSVDSVFTHKAWRNTPINEGGIGPLKFPLVSDITKNISRCYGVLVDEAKSLRGSFLIDKEGVIQHAIVNNLPLGRSVDEALRMVDALQHHEKYGEVCPANWKLGEAAMKASDEGVKDYLSKTFK